MKDFTPELNKVYTLKEIQEAFGLHRSFAFWNKKKEVSAFTLNPDMNPSVKDYTKAETLKILVAKGPLRESNIKRILLNRSYPVFIKKDANQWKYIGDYNCCGFTTNQLEIAPSLRGLEKQLDKIVCVITLEKEVVSFKNAA